MEVKCPKCGTTNTVEDDSLTESGIRIPCAGCGVKLVVKKKIKKTPPPPPPLSEPPPLKLTEEEGFYMPDEGLKTGLESEPKQKDLEEQFFDAGFSLGGEAEGLNKSPEFDLSDINNLKEEVLQEERISKEPPLFSEEKPAEEPLSGFDLLTDSLFSNEEISEKPVPVEEAPKPPQAVKTPEVIKKIPARKVQIGRKEEKRRVNPLFGILFIIMVGAGVFYWKGKEVVGKFFQEITENSQFDIKITNQNFLVTKRGEKVYFIVGKVRPKGMVVDNIKLKATLYDKNNFEKSSIELYAGNILKDEELRELSPFVVYERLQNEVGEMFSNLNVTPEKGVDFMAVFYDPPPGIEQIQVTVIDYRKK